MRLLFIGHWWPNIREDREMLHFTGSSVRRRAQVRSADDGFSVFLWQDSDIGVSSWQEHHGLSWDAAFTVARQWLN
jgi:hypothetical protein